VGVAEITRVAVELAVAAVTGGAVAVRVSVGVNGGGREVAVEL
jgi:hypothetical protein